jgi:hypothetical protein
MIDPSIAGNEDEALALALLKAMEDGDLRDFYDIACYDQQPTAPDPEHAMNPTNNKGELS